jgi:lysophospholipase L1-like esterase
VKRRSLVFAALAALLLVVSACGSPTQPPPPPPPPPPVIDPPPVVPPTWDATKLKIMAFGDSLTEDDSDTLAFRYWGAHHDPSGPGGIASYPYKLREILAGIYTAQTFTVFNYGFGGEKATDSQTNARLNTALINHPPDVLLLMHGTNDLLSGLPKSDIIAAVGQLVQQAQARGVVVFLASLPPQSTVVKGQPNDAASVPEYNERLRNLAAARGVFFVDIYPYITAAMLEPDGLHLLEPGNRRMAEVFYEALKARYHTDPVVAAALGSS